MVDLVSLPQAVHPVGTADGARPAIVERAPATESGLLRLSRMAPARPGHFAEREELDAALAAGTAGALQLFIERHPKSRYRDEAEMALTRLGIKPPSR